jgi:hypothetical protein
MLKFTRLLDSARLCSEGCLSRIALRVAVVTAALGVSVVMNAQTSSYAPNVNGTAAIQANTQVAPKLNFQVPANDALFSSSADEDIDALVTPPVPDFSKMMLGTGGGHAQNGMPHYRGAYTNTDDSMKFIAYGGAGATVPLGNTSKYLTPNFDIQAGAGYRFNRHFALPVEFDWDQFGFTKQALDNQIAIYDSLFGTGSVNYLLDGNSHIWSFSLQPTYTFYSGDTWGAYVKGGVGFYHKVANFTLPSQEVECYYYCGVYDANFNLDHYTSNAPGYDGGVGVTYRFSPDSHARFYAEARYVFVDNQQRTGITNTSASLATVNSSTTDFYPANSNRTTYIPIEVGIRF